MGELVDVAMAFRDKLLQGWTKGASARDASGRAVRVNSPEAVEWCLDGARCAALHDETVLTESGTVGRLRTAEWPTIEVRVKLEELITTEIGQGYWPGWNDRRERTYAEVLATADGVVRRAKEWEESHG